MELHLLPALAAAALQPTQRDAVLAQNPAALDNAPASGLQSWVNADLMSDISENAWRAGWMQGLEYELWTGLEAAAGRGTRRLATQAQLERLGQLSKACSGWIVFDQERENAASSYPRITNPFGFERIVPPMRIIRPAQGEMSLAKHRPLVQKAAHSELTSVAGCVIEVGMARPCESSRTTWRDDDLHG